MTPGQKTRLEMLAASRQRLCGAWRRWNEEQGHDPDQPTEDRLLECYQYLEQSDPSLLRSLAALANNDDWWKVFRGQLARVGYAAAD
jgi:hypothetical protein